MCRAIPPLPHYASMAWCSAKIIEITSDVDRLLAYLMTPKRLFGVE
jgi:hypothetical protein